MTKRLSLAALVLSTAAVALAYAAAFLPRGTPPWAPWLLALGTPAMMVAVMALGAARGGDRGGDRGGGRRWALGAVFALTFVVTGGALAAALAMPAAAEGGAAADPLWLGLPPRAAVVLYGVGLVPMLFLPLAYALTFDEGTLGADDLERVRRAREAREAREAAAAAGRSVPSSGRGAPPEIQDSAGPAGDRHHSVAERSERLPVALPVAVPPAPREAPPVARAGERT
ncbi:MAG TPA: hypothetical protein VKA84_28375 [Gemmatimonadaceae bacterium]|nr:hypothetical protein [Gemmatimonadaceae bacterium]